MPIPKPKSKESDSDFVSRCMGDSVMLDDYPDKDQRSAVCYAQIEKAAKSVAKAEYNIVDDGTDEPWIHIRETDEYYRVRLREPGDFDEESFVTVDFDTTAGIKAVMGKLMDEDTLTVQALMFPKDKYSLEETQTWCREHAETMGMEKREKAQRKKDEGISSTCKVSKDFRKALGLPDISGSTAPSSSEAGRRIYSKE
jgi:hypothetical protein